MENGRKRQRTVRGRRKGRGRCRWRDVQNTAERAARCRRKPRETKTGICTPGVEGQRGVSTVDARSTTSPAEAGLKSYVGYAFARVHGTESGRINFVVDDAFAVTEYYILQ